MSFPVFATGDVLNASDMNAVGLWLVKTQTVGSGVASVTVASAFSTDYDNYLITVTGMYGSASGAALYFQCVTSGGAANASNWKGSALYTNTGTGSTVSIANDNNSASTAVGFVNLTNASSLSFNIYAPYLSQRTTTSFNSADAAYFRVGASILDNATSYTGFTLSPNAGTMTGGTIRVYGYRN